MRLSIVIVTHNRCDALSATLDVLTQSDDLPRDAMEIIVVDNGSTDATAAMIEKRVDLPVRRIELARNEGVSARNHAFSEAQGEFILLIDDDSYPMGNAVSRSLSYLDEHGDCAAVVGRVVLPDGRLEASALPGVIANGAVVLRKAVLDKVGGFPREFFRQAEEYDLSFRIWNAGYRIERFEDLVYRHDKVGMSRSNALIHRMDMRNNLILLSRYLPRQLRREYRSDWAQRYASLSKHAGFAPAARRGRIEAVRWQLAERLRGQPHALGPHAVESVFQLQSQAQMVAQWKVEHGIDRVLIADFGKNLYATWRAVKQSGASITAIADENPAFARNRYRGLSILSDEAAIGLGCDGIVLANVNPARIESRLGSLKAKFAGPVLGLWQPKTLIGEAGPAPGVRTPTPAVHTVEAA